MSYIIVTNNKCLICACTSIETSKNQCICIAFNEKKKKKGTKVLLSLICHHVLVWFEISVQSHQAVGGRELEYSVYSSWFTSNYYLQTYL